MFFSRQSHCFQTMIDCEQTSAPQSAMAAFLKRAHLRRFPRSAIDFATKPSRILQCQFGTLNLQQQLTSFFSGSGHPMKHKEPSDHGSAFQGANMTFIEDNLYIDFWPLFPGHAEC